MGEANLPLGGGKMGINLFSNTPWAGGLANLCLKVLATTREIKMNTPRRSFPLSLTSLKTCSMQRIYQHQLQVSVLLEVKKGVGDRENIEHDRTRYGPLLYV